MKPQSLVFLLLAAVVPAAARADQYGLGSSSGLSTDSSRSSSDSTREREEERRYEEAQRRREEAEQKAYELERQRAIDLGLPPPPPPKKAKPFGTKSSVNSSNDENSSSNSTSADPNAKRKLVVPMQARDEAALWIAAGGVSPPSLLLRATIAGYRALLRTESTKQAPSRPLSDLEVVALLLTRTEYLRY